MKIINQKSNNRNSTFYFLLSKFSLFFLLSIFYFLFSFSFAFASVFSFDTQNKIVSVGEQFKIDLNINTEKENINAVEGKIVFPTDLLELSEIRSGNSVVNFWVEKPSYKDGGVTFSGITPGGYVLDKVLILSLVFKAKSEGTALINIENGNVLLNDGNGTQTDLKTSDIQITISGSSSNQTENLAVVDKTPPDAFKPEVAQDPNLFDNKWFVIFVAQDKDSGIAKYQVKESRYIIFDFSKWQDAESPYVLTDQTLASNIYVKAIDKAGNERIIKLSPQNPLPLYANPENWFIIGLVIIVALIFFYKKKLWKKN